MSRKLPRKTLLPQGSIDEDWHVVAASVPGVKHIKVGKALEDAMAFRKRYGILMVAMADGAGSAKFGRQGAEIAVSKGLECLNRAFPRKCNRNRLYSRILNHRALLGALKETTKAIEENALANGLPTQDFACTLLLLIATQKTIAVAQVGDGAIIGRQRGGDLIALTRPQTGEYINTTYFITTEKSQRRDYICEYQVPLSHVAVFTDGLQSLALNSASGAPFSGFFEPIFRFASDHQGEDADIQLTQFLQSPRVADRTDDDLSLLIASLR